MNEKDTEYSMTSLSPIVFTKNSTSKLWSEQMGLHGGIFYVRYMEGSTNVQAKVIKMIFKSGMLMYADFFAAKPTLESAKYEINEKDLIIMNKNKKLVIFNTIVKVTDTYIVASVKMKGKKINTARYYYRKNDAFGYTSKK